MVSRKRQQRSVRKGHTKVIGDHLWKRLKSKSHKKRIHTTNSLLPPGGLRRQVIQKIFGGWILQFYGEGRILTKKLAKDVCKYVRKKMDLGPSGEEGDEAKRMHMLLKAARKRKIQKPLKAMSSMDNLETVPMHLDDYGEEDWATLGFFGF